ncbi:hypothetical protein BO94DRAFT_478745 [Aspergillus sclerotioniger CBS 115572]|uniref:Uncharacterized protein n=1 Tax=Aspergillus sclerotioniger CBS 115572 TaxID=1450535 RepID=A0A317V072_9EURO|nr:hypothetical protein BO94DRAFT_478745 [Aspergillus sclerotioniger CBS 115572]PWY67653.1 hypothetical protein BO94DRAFT_478745 [Aspergillus sclerotioniger CBS 115572]
MLCVDGRSIMDALRSTLAGCSDLQQLEILTDVLLVSPSVDERLAEVISASWDYLCDQHLWSLKYESLQHFRQIISYSKTVKPIISRFKKSDRKKMSCLEIVNQNWGRAPSEVIPPDLAPITWSKHLLCLLATLSKRQSSDQAVPLLQQSIRERPRRSRQQKGLIASDVQRAIDKVLPSETRDARLKPSASGEIEPCVVNQLLHWAQAVSWSNICATHLQTLARLRFGPSTVTWSRSKSIEKIEDLLSSSRKDE